MVVRKKLNQSDLDEILHHKDFTAKELVKVYKPCQISAMDYVDTQKIPRSIKYIPVRVDHKEAWYRYRTWKSLKPYSVRYIRVDELLYIFAKRNKDRKLVIEHK